jgi:hypothetical protein
MIVGLPQTLYRRSMQTTPLSRISINLNCHKELLKTLLVLQKIFK